MKKYIIFPVLVLFGFLNLNAQNNPKITQAKKEFFAQKLDLTMNQIENFWPTYEEMRKNLKVIASNKKISCKDPEEIKECLNFDEDYVKTRNIYLERISKYIGQHKAMQIPKVEKEFFNVLKTQSRH